MRQSKVVLCVAVALFGITTVGLAEGEGDVTFGVGADFMSKYVWRGQNLVDDWVLQPNVSASYQGFTASIWANSDMTGDSADDWELTELDYTIDYSGTVPGADGIGYSVGAIHYYFPGGEATTELYWGFSFDVPASPSVTVYHDVDVIDGTYVALGFGHSFEDIEDLPFGIDLSANLGWGDCKYNDGYWSTLTMPSIGSELNDLVLSAAFPFEVGGVSVTPSVSYITLLGSDVKDSEAYHADSSMVVAGIGFAKEF
jgi:Bacterial protein of unknown function (Gcw_chp)